MLTTADDDRLIEILLIWDGLRQEGRDAPAEELCADCPELAVELERRIQVLRAMEVPLGEEDAPSSVDGPLTESPSAGDGSCRPVATATVVPESRYRRLRLHARGGLGEVFVAHDQELDREVALKEIQDHLARDPVSRSRFLVEAEVTAGLEHPGVVPVHGMGHYPDGRPFYAMRLIRGESLRAAIARLHAVEPAALTADDYTHGVRSLLRRFLDVCNAVAYAHSRGVIHRDLKPANIMLGRYGETLVVDWGLAKRLDRPDSDASNAEGWLGSRSAEAIAATQPGGVSGTPAYMSPEQARGEVDRLGPATDIYSLSATLYCLLTGKAPVEEGSPLTVLDRVRRGEFPPPRAVRAGIPLALEAICLKAISFQPDDRYQTVQALSDDLEKWLAGLPVSAYREPFTDRARRWLGRHRTLVTATTAGVVIAILSLAGIVWLLADANRREHALVNRAVAEKDRAEKAQKGEMAEAARAREEARKATMLSGFLVRLFQSSDPLGLEGQGFREPTEGVKSLTAVQLLRRGAERLKNLSKTDGSDDATVAVLLDAVGNSLRSLGDIEQARPLLERALKVRNGSPKANDRELADSLFHLGILVHDTQEFEAAERHYRDALRIYRDAGSDDLTVARVKFRLAWLYAQVRRMDEAEQLFREVLQSRQARHGTDHPEIQAVRFALLVVLMDRGDTKALLTQAPELLGRNNVVVQAMVVYIQAMAFRRARNYPVAKRLYENVLSSARKFLPAQHPMLAMLLGDMAGMYRETGDLRRTEKLIREVLEIGRRTIPLHPLMIEGLTSYADEMAKQSRIEEAERLYVEALEDRQATQSNQLCRLPMEADSRATRSTGTGSGRTTEAKAYRTRFDENVVNETESRPPAQETVRPQIP